MTYAETRRHTLARTRLAMVDGNLVENVRSEIGGTSVRRYEGGYWGFAAVPGDGAAVAGRVAGEAGANARAMGRFGRRDPVALAAAPTAASTRIAASRRSARRRRSAC